MEEEEEKEEKVKEKEKKEEEEKDEEEEEKEEKVNLVSCAIKALVCCTSSVRCNSGSWLGGRFPVSATAHVLCISSCLVPAHVQISL